MIAKKLEEPDQARKNILVVEDERVVARDIQRSLSDLGYSVPATAASAEQAMLLAAERCPDLVLMDIRIKGKHDGIETASLLRERFNVPIVYLTAYADECTVARAKQTEPFGYLLKPVKVNELRSAVEIALYKHDMEKRLRERERWLATTMRSIGDAIISVDRSGAITYMNPVAERLTKWKAEDALGRSSDEVLHLLDDRTGGPVLNPLLRALHDASPSSIEAVLVRSEGPGRFISDSTAPILDDGRMVTGAVMVFRDVTEQRQLRLQLETSERLATIGTMTAGIAHEVNNPLSFVLTNVTLARKGLQKLRSEPQALENTCWIDGLVEGLDDAEQGARRIAKIIRELMDFTRSAPEATERVNLSEVLDWGLRVAGHELKRRGRLVRRFGASPPVDASSARLGQVFVNLLLNAAQALDVDKRGTNEVTVTIRTDQLGRAVVEVGDNGCGMTSELMERAFEPFVTTKAVGQGTGLGLSVCQGIVSSYAGTIVFESKPGAGTVARVTLPPARPQAEETRPVCRSVDAARAYVMVVDDEATVRGSIRRVLGDLHDVTCPKTSRDAMALIRAGLRFDLIVCVALLFDRGGLGFYQEIQRLDPEQARRIVCVRGGQYAARTVEFLCSGADISIDRSCELRDLNKVAGGILAEMGPIPRRKPIASTTAIDGGPVSRVDEA